MNNKLVEAFMIAIVGGIVTFLGPFFMVFFFQDNPDIKIGKPIQIEEKQFLTPINISVYDKKIKELRLNIPSTIIDNQIKSDFPLNISIIKNSVKTAEGTDIAIKDISSNKNIQLAFVTSSPIDDKEINLSTADSNINITYLSEIENPAISQVKRLLLNAIVYAIIVGLMSYFQIRDREKRIKKSTDKYDEILEEISKSKETANELNDSRIRAEEDMRDLKKAISIAKNDSLKRHLLLQAKAHDYRKELNFWRDTIRKLLYDKKTNNKNADDLFKMVSSALKTYHTHEKNVFEYEELKVLSKYVLDIENKCDDKTSQ